MVEKVLIILQELYQSPKQEVLNVCKVKSRMGGRFVNESLCVDLSRKMLLNILLIALLLFQYKNLGNSELFLLQWLLI